MKRLDAITEIRGFNRYYTNILGLLDKHIYDSDFSLTEVRVIFEINKIGHCTANKMCSSLGIDRSYMSRMIKRLEKEGIVSRCTRDDDRRNMEIKLTETGVEVLRDMNQRSDSWIGNILAKLTDDDLEEIIKAIHTLKRHFTTATNDIKIRPYQDTDIEYVISRQLSLYESEQHFTTDTWKSYVTQGVISLVERFNLDKDCIYILECNEKPSGCIAITHTDEKTAQLRYYFLEPELRGIGAGAKLLIAALDFCREKDYSHIFLWTADTQEKARDLYKKNGFQLTETSKNETWGVPVVEEKWEMDL